jgi:hypothetical protein
MTAEQLRNPEALAYLIIYNNPTEAAYFLGTVDGMDYTGADPAILCDRAAAQVASGQTEQLMALLGQVHIIPNNLTPEALQNVTDLAARNAKAKGYKSFDWGNMEFWGQVMGGLMLIGGAAAANANGTTAPGTTEPGNPAPAPSAPAPDYTMYYVGGGLALAGIILIIYLTRKKK